MKQTEYYIANTIERILNEADGFNDRRLKIECIARVILESKSAESIHKQLRALCDLVEGDDDVYAEH